MTTKQVNLSPHYGASWHQRIAHTLESIAESQGWRHGALAVRSAFCGVVVRFRWIDAGGRAHGVDFFAPLDCDVEAELIARLGV